MQTKLVLLGTGTPNACPNANGPSSAVVVGDRAYLVDFGPGVVRQASAAYFNGVDALRPDLLTVAFCTHLHTDHTAGYPDLIFTPWVLERPVPLKVFGPKGLQHMTDHILQAYETDIDFRIHGFEKANESGYRVEVTEIESGIVYRDDLVTVEAFPVSHGTLECYGYKFTTPDRTIVITGDTAPLDLVAEKSKGCDILLHEVEYAAGISCREPKWQKYHREVHTLSTDLAGVAKKANPKLLVTYHRIYHMNVQDNHKNLAAEMAWRDTAILDEIRDAACCRNNRIRFAYIELHAVVKERIGIEFCDFMDGFVLTLCAVEHFVLAIIGIAGQMPHIGYIHDALHIIAKITEVFFKDIFHYIASEVTDMRKVIHSGTAGIHSYGVILYGKLVFFSC